MLQGNRWRRLFPDVYLAADIEPDHGVWCEAAALLLPPGSAISGRSALATLCGSEPRENEPVEVTVPPTTNLRSGSRLRVRRSTLAPGDTFRFGDLPVTTPTRTAIDLARTENLTDAVIALDALLLRGVVTKADVAAYARASTLHGIRRVRRALDLAAIGAESPMETRTRLTIVLAGLPPPVPQFKVFDATGSFIARLDLAFPDAKVGIEYDGDHHRDRFVFTRDAWRLNRLRLAGWTILRFTADDVLRYPDRVVAQVRTALGG